MIVAIDGPAGAGKSTVSLRVAEALGFRLVSTGALYRAVALLGRERGTAWDDAVGLAAIGREVGAEFRIVDGDNRVLIDGEDRSEALRVPEISQGASIVSAHPAVRRALVDLQRDYARRHDVVMEGRDIGTVIFPDAEVKVFLTASVEERARRRERDYVDAGEQKAFADVLSEIEERDARDSGRAVAPLRQAEDAVLVDATDATIDEVVEGIVRLVMARG